MPELSNPRAERVKAVKALAGRSSRRRTGHFLVEGPQGVREALRCCPAAVRELYLSRAAADRHPDLVRAADEGGVQVRTGTPEVLEAMSPDGQGAVAVVEQLTETLGRVLAAAPALVAVLATVRDPGNAGAVIRAADAAGADAVVLAGESVELHNPKVVRSSAGSIFHLPVVTGLSVQEAVAALRDAGLAVLAATGDGTHDVDDLLDRVPPPGSDQGIGPGRPEHRAEARGPGGRGDGVPPDLTAPTAWLFGNEARGLSPQELTLADSSVRVPIHGLAESLNLATAATLCLYASARARRA
ncbi:RNA methyltransferase [Actinotalea sp. C106]|uniref:TrmH family RNA methyltransferase n=1 Tax=Actinotalea sp. C106 TaxID=2908644 RepID=UPI0020299052|nr:RNA methyltransferase [Actinotalea sp. C106]